MTALDIDREWEGSGLGSLADRVGSTLRDHPALSRGGKLTGPNKRLLDHYRAKGLLSPGRKDGRAVIYGYRHILETLFVRLLLADGWPLDKIVEMAPSRLDEAKLLEMISPDTPKDEAKKSPADAGGALSLVRAFQARAGVGALAASASVVRAYDATLSRARSLASIAAEAPAHSLPGKLPAVPPSGRHRTLSTRARPSHLRRRIEIAGSAPWLTAYVDEGALNTLSERDVDTAAAQLALEIKNLTQGV
jgi:DNA-binding transcriptional MerR regulator